MLLMFLVSCVVYFVRPVFCVPNDTNVLGLSILLFSLMFRCNRFGHRCFTSWLFF